MTNYAAKTLLVLVAALALFACQMIESTWISKHISWLIKEKGDPILVRELPAPILTHHSVNGVRTTVPATHAYVFAPGWERSNGIQCYLRQIDNLEANCRDRQGQPFCGRTVLTDVHGYIQDVPTIGCSFTLPYWIEENGAPLLSVRLDPPQSYGTDKLNPDQAPLLTEAHIFRPPAGIYDEKRKQAVFIDVRDCRFEGGGAVCLNSKTGQPVCAVVVYSDADGFVRRTRRDCASGATR